MNSRQVCEVIWYRSRMTNPPWPHRWSCWLLAPWMELACGSWRNFISGAFPALLKLQWRAMQWLASFHLSWEDSRLWQRKRVWMVFQRVATPTTKTGYKMVPFARFWTWCVFHEKIQPKCVQVASNPSSSTSAASRPGIFPQFLWSYLIGTFLQASTITTALVSVNVMFFEPL